MTLKTEGPYDLLKPHVGDHSIFREKDAKAYF